MSITRRLDIIALICWLFVGIALAALIAPIVERVGATWLIGPVVILGCVLSLSGAFLVRKGVYRAHRWAVSKALKKQE